MRITVHVNNNTSETPPKGLHATLEMLVGSDWHSIGLAETDSGGRIDEFETSQPLTPGRYRLRFDTDTFWKQTMDEPFYPQVTVEFMATKERKYHIVLNLSQYGYNTQLGS